MPTIDLIFLPPTTFNYWEGWNIRISLFNIYDRKNQWYTEYEILEGEILETEVNYRDLHQAYLSAGTFTNG